MTLTKQQTPTKIPTLKKVEFGNPVMHSRMIKNQFKPKYSMILTEQQTPTKIPTVKKVKFRNPVMHSRITGSK